MQITDCTLRIGRMRRIGRIGIPAALAAVLGSSAAYGQQPATPPAAVQSAAAPAPAAQEPVGDGASFTDRAQAWAKKHQIMERLNGEVDGWYPRLGRMTRGGGFALGPGYRFHPAGGPVLVDLSAGISVKAYKSVDANVRWFQSSDERIEIWTDYRYEDFPQEDYFGPGFTSSVDTRTNYRFQSHDASIRGLYRPRPWWSVGARLGYMAAETGSGTDDKYPSIEELFTDAQAPGLFTSPNYLHSTLYTEIDYRDVKGNPGSGGFYRASFGFWDDRQFEAYDFRRFDLNLNQFVPLVPSKKHVVFGRLGLSYINNDATSRVPFYFLPYVGGVDTIRSFREFRYREENAIWLGAEYLFRPIDYVSLAAFVDSGKVARDWQDVNFSDMKKGYGFGFRFGTAKTEFGRIDFGFGGGEGRRVFFKFGPRL
jgi:outer membrane protein assembly factor BamA